MDFVIAVPARLGSTRLPGKALAEIGGEPMVVRVWRRCLLVRGASRVLVATDAPEIRDAVRSAGGECVLTAASHCSGTDRIAEAVRDLRCDLVVNVQGDEPFLQPALVEELVAACAEPGAPDAATAATPVRDARELYDPSVVKVLVGRGGDAVYFSRYPIPFSRDLWEIDGEAWRRPSATPGPGGHLKHLGIYAYRPEFLQRLTALAPTPGERAERLEQLRILEHGHRLRVVVTPWESLGVDTPADLERARRRAREEAGAGTRS